MGLQAVRCPPTSSGEATPRASTLQSRSALTGSLLASSRVAPSRGEPEALRQGLVEASEGLGFRGPLLECIYMERRGVGVGLATPGREPRASSAA